MIGSISHELSAALELGNDRGSVHVRARKVCVARGVGAGGELGGICHSRHAHLPVESDRRRRGPAKHGLGCLGRLLRADQRTANRGAEVVPEVLRRIVRACALD